MVGVFLTGVARPDPNGFTTTIARPYCMDYCCSIIRTLSYHNCNRWAFDAKYSNAARRQSQLLYFTFHKHHKGTTADGAIDIPNIAVVKRRFRHASPTPISKHTFSRALLQRRQQAMVSKLTRHWARHRRQRELLSGILQHNVSRPVEEKKKIGCV